MGNYKWTDFYNYADEIIHSSHPNETIYRTAASRAYYACYHQALILAHSVDPSKIKLTFTGHKELIEWFKTKTSHPDFLNIGQTLFALRDCRHDADYHSQRFKKEMASLSISRAKQLISVIRKLEQNTTNKMP